MYSHLTAEVASGQTRDSHHLAALSRHRRAARDAAAEASATREKAAPAYRSDRVALARHVSSGGESRPARA